MPISYTEALLLALYHNDVNITTCNISPNQIIISHGIPHLAWYSQKLSIPELRKFRCDIYPITSSTKELDEVTQEVELMVYTNRRSTMK